jgi:hypothetical protein
MKTPIYVNFDLDLDGTEEETKRYLEYFLDELYILGVLRFKPTVDYFGFVQGKSISASITLN